MMIPSGTESARAFIPAKDFNSSKAFYEALGFKKLLDSDVAIFGVERFHPAALLSKGMGRKLHDAIDGRQPRRMVGAY
jgi:predicted lactoylglutathione lyase